MEIQAYILVLGIDVGEDGGYKIYAQVGEPAGNKNSSQEEPLFKTLVSQGRNLSEAVARLFLESTKEPELAHLQLLILSGKIASEGVRPVLDFLRRDLGVRENIRVVVAAAEMEDLLKVEEKLSNQPALAIINQFIINSKRLTMVQAELRDFISQILEPDLQAALPMIGIGEDRFTLGETAVFDGYKMVATLTLPETMGLQLWRNQVRRGLVTIPLTDLGEAVSLEIIECKTKLAVRWLSDRLSIQVNSDVTLDIKEMVQIDSKELKKRVQHYFVNRLRDTLGVAQEKGVDFLGLSAALRRQDLPAWRSIDKNWTSLLRAGEFDLRCRVVIRGQGPIR